MKKQYDFDYDILEAGATFIVDLEIFTVDHAMATLNFFTWDFDMDNDPIDEVLMKYALHAIALATAENYNCKGVIQAFKDEEGYCPIDGSCGITLTYIDRYYFDNDKLTVKIKMID